MSKFVVFFDGVCGLCSRFVDFTLQHDKKGEIVFSPLQGTFAKAHLSESERRDLDYVVVIDRKGSTYRSSTAVGHVLIELGGIWALAGRFILALPLFFREACYRGVAKYRYRIFGKSESCRLPTPEERSRFLD